MASLPWHVKRRTAQGSDVAPEHAVYRLLHSEPNPHMTSFMFRETMLTHVLLYGNFYAWIERGGNNRPVAIWPFQQHEVSLLKYHNELFYNTKEGPIPAYDIIHVGGLGFDGISGKSPIRLQAEQLGVTLSAQKFGAKFFENGAHVSVALEHPGALTDKAYQNLKESFVNRHGGVDNVGRPMILENGMKVNRMGIPPEEAQFLQTRQLGAVEVCGMYRVPPHMVAILDRATFSNIEHQDIGFVKYTLLPWIERIQQEFDRKLFRDSEKGDYYNHLNVNGLLKGDIAAQTQHVREMMDRGVYNINMALAFLGQNTIGEPGERRMIMRNMVPLDRVDDTIKQETNQDNGEGKQKL
jgi:HK97 family phage portal protein